MAYNVLSKCSFDDLFNLKKMFPSCTQSVLLRIMPTRTTPERFEFPCARHPLAAIADLIEKINSGTLSFAEHLKLRFAMLLPVKFPNFLKIRQKAAARNRKKAILQITLITSAQQQEASQKTFYKASITKLKNTPKKNLNPSLVICNCVLITKFIGLQEGRLPLIQTGVGIMQWMIFPA